MSALIPGRPTSAGNGAGLPNVPEAGLHVTGGTENSVETASPSSSSNQQQQVSPSSSNQANPSSNQANPSSNQANPSSNHHQQTSHSSSNHQQASSNNASCPQNLMPPNDQSDNGCLSRPPSYSGPPVQPLFLPYITQELPSYSEMGELGAGGGISTGRGQVNRGPRESQLGFIHHSAGQYIPIQIPGYIATEDHHNTHTLRTAEHIRSPPPPARVRVRPTVEDIPTKDYLTPTFVLLALCILYLNLPAILFSLSALACAIKAKELNSNRMYGESKRYSSMVLICNAMAILEHVTVIAIAFLVLASIFIFDFQVF